MDLVTRRAVLTSLLGLVSLAAVVVYGDHEDDGPRAIRVLFIGNSYTSVNDLPQIVRRLGAGAKPAVDVTVVRHTEGGATLQRHWDKEKAVRLIEAGKFDCVVLQEQSMLPVIDPGQMSQYARKLDEAARASGAKTVLYMTWARRGNPQMLDPVARAYEALGRELGAKVAPVGRAWAAALAEDAAPQLHAKDDSHPTQAGSYLAACVLYETLTGRDCRGLGNAGLEQVTAGMARRLQNVAHATVNPGQ